ncbi:CHAT domain-containing protein [Rhodoferax sp.]|uniref:CHAT domain-containing protein n=1 Tax=Rhodoferax sp. TaxID=50421 RepID=UPI00274E41C8|nr:CHAT domain-containing protein [Rhodoferax sp.]
MSPNIRRLMAITLAGLTTLSVAQQPLNWASLMATGAAARQGGGIDQSIAHFQRARQLARDDAERTQAARELGATLLQARRLDQAALSLHDAQSLAVGEERAGLAIDLGNLALLRKDPALATEHYNQAKQMAAAERTTGLFAELSLARLQPPAQRAQGLEALYRNIGNHATGRLDARLYLSLGQQALNLGRQTDSLGYRSLNRAHTLASQAAPGSRVHLESLDALAQWHEAQGHIADATRLNREAVMRLRGTGNDSAGDLAVALAWRSARLYLAQGQDQLALTAYQSAVNQLERMRQDIPIEYDDGQSSFRSTFEPIYLGLVDTLLKIANTEPQAQLDATLRRARDTIELLKQTEMQDYLGDRCAVDAVKGGSRTEIAPGTLVLYPIIFADRIELLVETPEAMVRFSTTVPNQAVQATASALAGELRNHRGRHLSAARQLYDWILRPLEVIIRSSAIDTVVFVPDGTMRTIPLGALHDGQQYAIEKYAIATVTGLTMTNTLAPLRKSMTALVAGASSFGQVVDKYGSTRLAVLLADASAARSLPGSSPDRLLRLPRASATRSAAATAPTRAENLESLRDALALPGVTKEVEALQRILPGTSLLDARFTVDAFRLAAQSQQHRIVHVASHGVFGGSADSSYILAYDDLLTLDGLQSMLSGEQFHKHPIELLSLSACETAAGNDRAPLGISGAAMKARAKSVLGTLWPVDDEAAVLVMENFYRGLTQQGLSKAQALRQSQRQLIGNRQLAHPFYWAPFALIGNWL